MSVRQLLIAAVLLALIGVEVGVLLDWGAAPTPASAPASQASPGASPSAPATVAPLPSSSVPKTVVYLYYYMWWTPEHWLQKLGAQYPSGSEHLPLPGRTNAQGCNPTTNFSGASIVDVPQQGLYNQDQASSYEIQIEEAVQAGVTGFLASWQGTGTDHQSTKSSGYDRRLALLVQAVDSYNASHPTAPFYLGLAFSAFGDYTRPASEILADLDYFSRVYAHDPAFRNPFSSHPIVVFMDSRKFAVSTVAAVWNAEHADEYLVGDETPDSWSRDQAYLNASTYYWSSEDPYTNHAAQADVASLGQQVHSAAKKWFAPFTPGYDKQLAGGSCVPRDGVATLDKLWSINSASSPQAWFGISWNEFVENTYMQPSLAYGSTYLNELKRLIQAG